MNKRSLLLLLTIFILGLLVRVLFLGQVPRGFTPDEASQAYTAYSLLKTGKDEWGAFFPFTSFKSFLDYKSPLQTYLLIPSIKIFGLNEFATRLPSAIFGSLAIISIYFLTKKLFEDQPLFSTSFFNIGHLSAIIFAFSPWAIQFSRMALEANLSVLLVSAGLYFFLLFPKKPQSLIFTAILLSLALYSYHAAKLFLPLFCLSIFLIYFKTIISKPKSLVAALFFAFIIVSPLFFNLLSDSKRGRDLLITNLSGEQQSKLNDSVYFSQLRSVSSFIPRLFHNKPLHLLNTFTNNYLSYFSPQFWFLEGGREITYSVIPGRGLLFLLFLPFLLLGGWQIYKSSLDTQKKLFLLAWLLIAPLPAALTKEGYRPNRAVSFMGFWEIIISVGVWCFIVENQKIIYKKLLPVVLLFCLSVVFYLEDYSFGSFVNYPTAMSYGWREALLVTKKIDNQYKNFYIERGGQPQSMISFYYQIDPSIFQKNSLAWDKQIAKQDGVTYLDQLGDYSLEKYRFKQLSWPEDKNSDTLYLAKTTNLLPNDRHTIKKILTPQGETLFEIFDFPKNDK